MCSFTSGVAAMIQCIREVDMFKIHNVIAFIPEINSFNAHSAVLRECLACVFMWIENTARKSRIPLLKAEL